MTHTELPITAEEMFAGRVAEQHSYYELNNLTQLTPSKEDMYERVEKLVLEYAVTVGRSTRFMSLPGRYWRFENRLDRAMRQRNTRVYFAGFERDENVILSGKAYVPRRGIKKHSRHIYFQSPRFRSLPSLNTEYFRTNRARWMHMDVNTALTLNNGMFQGPFIPAQDKESVWRCWMEWWLGKFCQWDAVWLDYYGPCSDKMGAALANLYYHCRNDVTPVVITVMKGREADELDTATRKQWMIKRLTTGIGVTFKELDYVVYREGEGATMLNLIGLLCRSTNKT